MTTVTIQRVTHRADLRTLCRLLGWQGGTIHQVAAALAVDVSLLLYPRRDTRLYRLTHADGAHAGTTTLAHALELAATSSRLSDPLTLTVTP